MDFDFKAAFATYSNVALLRILASPEQYQRQAIEAAQEILTTRNITDEERAEANPELYARLSIQTLAEHEDSATAGLFDNIAPFKPTKRFRTIIRGIVAGIGIQFLGSLYIIVSWFWFTVQYGFDTWGLMGIMVTAGICGLAGYFLYLLVSGARWGWILTYGFTLYLSARSGLALFASLASTYNRLAPIYIGMIAINSSVLYYLMRPEIYDHYLEYRAFVKFRLWGMWGTVICVFLAWYFTYVFKPGASF